MHSFPPLACHHQAQHRAQLMRREAKEKNRESWYMAYIMDTNEEERAKGKTVEARAAR